MCWPSEVRKLTTHTDWEVDTLPDHFYLNENYAIFLLSTYKSRLSMMTSHHFPVRHSMMLVNSHSPIHYRCCSRNWEYYLEKWSAPDSGWSDCWRRLGMVVVWSPPDKVLNLWARLALWRSPGCCALWLVSGLEWSGWVRHFVCHPLIRSVNIEKNC